MGRTETPIIVSEESDREMFRANFYIVSATVIPVFFLALTLQGKQFDAVETMLQKLNDRGEKHLDRVFIERDDKRFAIAPGPFLRFALIQLIWTAIWVVTILVLLFSVLGEVFALLALDRGRAASSTQEIVLIAVLGLTIGVGLLLYIRVQILWGANMVSMFRAYLHVMQLSIAQLRHIMQAARLSQPRRSSNSGYGASEQSHDRPQP